MSKSIIDPILAVEAVVEELDRALPPFKAVHDFWAPVWDPLMALGKLTALSCERAYTHPLEHPHE